MIKTLRYIGRRYKNQPIYVAAVILIFAIGIGGSTTIFSIIEVTLLRKPPFKDPDRLVYIDGSIGYLLSSSPKYTPKYKEINEIIDQFARYEVSKINLHFENIVKRINVSYVSSDYFSLLGLEPFLGATSFGDKKQVDFDQGIILSYDLWATLFTGDRNILGKPIRLNDSLYTIMGVMPKEFSFYDRDVKHDAWIYTDPRSPLQYIVNISAIARLKQNLSLEEAAAKLNLILQHSMGRIPAQEDRIILVSLQEKRIGDMRRPLLFLLGAMSGVLLIACLNLTTLLLMRNLNKQKELAIRAVLGADRLSLLKLWLSESLLLVLLGGILGLLITKVIITLLQILDAFVYIPAISEVTVNTNVIGFALLSSIAIGVFQACILILKYPQQNIYAVLKQGGIGTFTQLSPRFRALTIISSIALSLVMLLNALLLIKSLKIMLDGSGFDYKNLLTLEMATEKYGDEERLSSFYRHVIDRVSALPGVTHAGTVNFLPNFSGSVIYPIKLEEQFDYTLSSRTVSSNYFQTMKIPLIKGRYFSDHDVKGTKPAIILESTAAKILETHFLKNESVIGKQLTFPTINRDKPIKYEVIGVVGDIKGNGLDIDSYPAFYRHSLQYPAKHASLVVRTAIDPASLINQLRNIIRDIDADQPIFSINIYEQQIMGSLVRRRVSFLLLSAFSVMAIILTIIGVFGVVSYSVMQQMHDIGVRMVLGARPIDILKMFLKHYAAIIMLGLLLGLIISNTLSNLLSSYYYGVAPYDVATLVIVISLIIISVIAASFIPLRRAINIDPMHSIRHE